MHTTVRSNFADFLRPMEGEVDCMYRDHLGLVTVGIGNLIDSPEAAWNTRNHGAPFVHKADHAVEATQSQVFAEWERVKNDESLIANPQRARDTAQLVLMPQYILNLLDGKLSEFEYTLKTHPPFADLDDWPADAQLGLFSMAWAMGSSFAHQDRWPSFSGAVGGAEPEWQAAATHCNMANAWMARRNAVNRGLFRNAAWATSEHKAFDSLYVAIPGRRPMIKLGNTDADHAQQGFDSDQAVTDLQGFLRYLGWYNGEPSGEFDPSTDEAVRGFQLFEQTLPHNQNFAVDGRVGQLSWAALGYLVGV